MDLHPKDGKDGKAFETDFELMNIKTAFSALHNPELNGIGEWISRELVETAHELLIQANLLKCLLLLASKLWSASETRFQVRKLEALHSRYIMTSDRVWNKSERLDVLRMFYNHQAHENWRLEPWKIYISKICLIVFTK